MNASQAQRAVLLGGVTSGHKKGPNPCKDGGEATLISKHQGGGLRHASRMGLHIKKTFFSLKKSLMKKCSPVVVVRFLYGQLAEFHIF